MAASGNADRMAKTADATDSNPLGGTNRLAYLLTRMEKLLAERYKFDVFAEKAINFGVVITYRQTWEPVQYQVGDLVKTIPLAPKEVVRYTTRSVTKKTRAQKELDDNLQTRRSESSDTTRAEEEIVKKAVHKTNFNMTASETFGGEGMDCTTTQSTGGSDENESANTKKDFRESVLKSAQEFREQHKVEVEVTESNENESTTFHEIQNPNDELAVTYLFYELQRVFKISEQLHELTPVILVANAVPAPNEIDDAWLMEHDWILNRVVLDDSFRPALKYLTTSFTGAEVNIKIRGQRPGSQGPGRQAESTDSSPDGCPGGKPAIPGRRRRRSHPNRANPGGTHVRQTHFRPDRDHWERRYRGNRCDPGNGRLRERDG